MTSYILDLFRKPKKPAPRVEPPLFRQPILPAGSPPNQDSGGRRPSEISDIIRQLKSIIDVLERSK